MREGRDSRLDTNGRISFKHAFLLTTPGLGLAPSECYQLGGSRTQDRRPISISRELPISRFGRVHVFFSVWDIVIFLITSHHTTYTLTNSKKWLPSDIRSLSLISHNACSDWEGRKKDGSVDRRQSNLAYWSLEAGMHFMAMPVK